MSNDENQKEDYGMILRTAMSAIPGLSVLATFWSEFEATKNAKRMQLFIDSLNALAACHGKELDAIKVDIARNEERVSLLEVTIDKVVKEWQDEKIKLHAILAVRNLASNASLEKKISLLERFSELSMTDLEVLQILGTSNSVQVYEIRKTLDYLIPILSKLEARGLITETGHGSRSMWKSAGSDDWCSKWKYKFYTATPIGIELLNAIKN